ncbi:hypothetical protein J2S43_007216 [Catenuloplanes nepalensis]|uniref:NADH dehydrogenase subunit 1 n=1 Tax=Catenuloplanes nepalensis TaxID=587533 RepID=A0ABT9N4S8_9ACTN|nr:hypothetical protein [Catenuloplanes nepalensis]
MVLIFQLILIFKLWSMVLIFGLDLVLIVVGAVSC